MLTALNVIFIKKIRNMVLKVQGFVLSLLEGKTLLFLEGRYFDERIDTKRRIRHFCRQP